MNPRWIPHIIAFGIWLATAPSAAAALILPGTCPLSEACGGDSTTASDSHDSDSPWQSPIDHDRAYGPGHDAGMTEPAPAGGVGASASLASAMVPGSMMDPAIGLWMAFYIAALIPEPPPFRLLRPPRTAVRAV
jgi:hypothetical protein